MFVRTASLRDLEQVRELLVETWHATYDAIFGEDRVREINEQWHSPERLQANLDEPHSEFLVADDGETIGGMAFARAAEEGKAVMLHQLYVRPALQGGGIGGLLLDEIEGCFPDAQKIVVDVEEANLKAVAFYEAQGFARTGSAEGGETGGNVIIFERPIVWAD